MNLRQTLGGLILILFLSGSMGCYSPLVYRSPDIMITVYTEPRVWRPGPMHVGVRFQSRDYQIIAPEIVRFYVSPLPQGPRESLEVRSGLGRDYRTRWVIPTKGQYRFSVFARLPNKKNIWWTTVIQASDPSPWHHWMGSKH
jgi:hypothetical protein